MGDTGLARVSASRSLPSPRLAVKSRKASSSDGKRFAGGSEENDAPAIPLRAQHHGGARRHRPHGAMERQCQSGASPRFKVKPARHVLRSGLPRRSPSTCDCQPSGRRRIQAGSVRASAARVHDQVGRDVRLAGTVRVDRTNASHSLTQRITEQPQDLLALSHLHCRLARETAAQHVLEKSAGARVRRDPGMRPRQPAARGTAPRRPRTHRREPRRARRPPPSSRASIRRMRRRLPPSADAGSGSGARRGAPAGRGELESAG